MSQIDSAYPLEKLYIVRCNLNLVESVCCGRCENSDKLLPKILENDSLKPFTRRKNATLNENLELSRLSISPRVESIDNDFPESYPEYNKTISKNHFDPESSASYDTQLEINYNENLLSYIEEENATSSYHQEIESSLFALPLPPSASPTPEGTDYIFSVSCNSENPTVQHLTRLKNVNYNVFPNNESNNDEDIDDSDADPNFSIRSHQSSSRSSVCSENESSEQSEVGMEEVKQEGEITKIAKLLRNSGKAYV
ncbi:hypothetical protein HHI36_013233 [Cryptolaemus montrouzieri]|uniref:Uncharacterized protein n=1 Tax=Cryptolaemus montrouzieri TaxID=559131 RepID=A0ABD2NHL1_9CUCU